MDRPISDETLSNAGDQKKQIRKGATWTGQRNDIQYRSVDSELSQISELEENNSDQYRTNEQSL